MNNRILVIDDMNANVDLMADYLRDANYDVMSSKDGISGIKKARAFKPDLIILDLSTPKMSGYDVCKTLKRDDETCDIIILVVTAIPSKESRSRAFESGADEYMEKSFDKETFIAKVKSLLRVKYLSDTLRENYSVLEEQTRQFEMQLEMAKHVQNALVSEVNFSYNGVSFISSYKPALSVGGDFYDIVTFGNGLISVFIADVSGHGISAALITSMLKIMFRNLVELHSEADKLLYHMNKGFYEIFSETTISIYACAFYAIIDTNTCEIRYSNAGGALPLYLNNTERSVSEIQLSGTPLGLLYDSEYKSESINYCKGDMLFFQTDGLCDSMYKNEPDMFVAKLSELLLDITDESNPVASDEIIDYILNQFYATNGSSKNKNDDVSIIICKMENL